MLGAEVAAKPAARKARATRAPKKGRSRSESSAEKATAQQSKNKQGRADHLKPHQWKPGQSGNPKGRVKGPSLEERFLLLLEKKIDDSSDKTRFDSLVDAIYDEGVGGNSKIMSEIMDRLWAKTLKVEGKVEVGDLTAAMQRRRQEREDNAG